MIQNLVTQDQLEYSEHLYNSNGNVIQKCGRVVCFNWQANFNATVTGAWTRLSEIPIEFAPKYQVLSFFPDGTQIVIGTDGAIIYYAAATGQKAWNFSLSWIQ